MKNIMKMKHLETSLLIHITIEEVAKALFFEKNEEIPKELKSLRIEENKRLISFYFVMIYFYPFLSFKLCIILIFK